MYKLISSDCYTHIVSRALDNLEIKINALVKEGYEIVGTVQVIKAEHDDVFAYVTMYKKG